MLPLVAQRIARAVPHY